MDATLGVRRLFSSSSSHPPLAHPRHPGHHPHLLSSSSLPEYRRRGTPPIKAAQRKSIRTKYSRCSCWAGNHYSPQQLQDSAPRLRSKTPGSALCIAPVFAQGLGWAGRMRTGRMRTGPRPARPAPRNSHNAGAANLALPYMSHRAIRRPTSELSVVQRLATTLCASNVPTPREGIATPGGCECQGRRTCCARVSLSVPSSVPIRVRGSQAWPSRQRHPSHCYDTASPSGQSRQEEQGVAPKRDSCPYGSLISVAVSYHCLLSVVYHSMLDQYPINMTPK
jgi:hypothetical protein